MKSFADLVELWGRNELAGDLGVPKNRVRNWVRHDSIPDVYWRALLNKAPDRGIDISPDLLIDFAARD